MTKYYILTDHSPESLLKNDIIIKIENLQTENNKFIEGVIGEVLNTFFEDESGTLTNGTYEEVKEPDKGTPVMSIDVSDYYQPDDDDEDYCWG